MAIGCRFPSIKPRYSQRHQFPGSGSVLFPLSPEDVPQFTADPAIQLLKNTFNFGQSEVVDPTLQKWFQVFGDKPAKISATTSTELSSQFTFQTSHTGRSDFQSRLLVHRHRVTKELTLPRAANRALVLIHLQLQLLLQVAGDRRQHPLACSPRLHINVAIIGVSAKRVTAPFQFLVQIVEQDVR